MGLTLYSLNYKQEDKNDSWGFQQSYNVCVDYRAYCRLHYPVFIAIDSENCKAIVQISSVNLLSNRKRKIKQTATHM